MLRIHTCHDHLLMYTCGISLYTMMWYSKQGNHMVYYISFLYISQPQMGSCCHFWTSQYSALPYDNLLLLTWVFLKLTEIGRHHWTDVPNNFTPHLEKMWKKKLYWLFWVREEDGKGWRNHALHRQISAIGGFIPLQQTKRNSEEKINTCQSTSTYA